MLSNLLNHALIVSFFISLSSWCSINVVEAQTKPSSTAVRGAFVQSENPKHQVDFGDFKLRLLEEVELPDADPPKNWEAMTVTERQVFLEKFKASKEGQALIAKRDAILKARHSFDIKIEPNGKWVVFDVPVGHFSIVNGRIDKTVDGQKFAFELFGQFDVSPKVEEVVLDPIPILVTPLFVSGDTAPEFELDGREDSSSIAKKDFAGKHLLIYFWSTASQPSVDYLDDVNQVFEELKSTHGLELLLVNLDQDKESAIKALDAAKTKGKAGFAGGAHSQVPESFGARALPSFWLLGPAGKILMTHNEIRRAGFSGKPLKEIVSNRIDVKEETRPADSKPNDADK